MVLSRNQLRSFDQRSLDMLVALFRQWHAHRLVGRTPFISAEAAVADGLLDRAEARNIPDLQRPRQCRDRTHARNRSEPFDPIGQHWIALKRTDQGVLGFLTALDRLPAELQQRPYARMDLLVLGEQFSEVTHLVQSLLVVLHTRLHQETRDTVLHLHHLSHQQMPLPQGAPSIPYRCRHHVALREEVAAQAVGQLAGIDPVVLLLGRRNRPQHQRMSHLYLFGVRKQVIIDPAREDRRLHGDHPWLRKSLQPAVQVASRRTDLALPVNLTAGILDAIADRLLVNIQPDVIHISHEEPPWLFSESASPLSSAYATPRAPHLT